MSRAPARNPLSARPGRVSSWLTEFAASETSSAPRAERVVARATAAMPSALATPVVDPRRKWARKPRSGPLQKSSASPSSAVAATASLIRAGARPPPSATATPTSGSRSPRWLVAVGPHASAASSSWRPRWRKPRASRAVARWASGSSRSSTRRPARAASIVIRTSQPNPGASGKQASRAAAESARWPESGSRASNPHRARTSARAARFAIPKPPPCRSAKAAMARSASSSRSGERSPSRSASQSRSGPGGASRSVSVSACPLPRRGRRTTRAPACLAAAAVESPEPSSATTISAWGNALTSASTVSPIRASSSRAATRIVSGSATRGERRERAVVGALLQPVLAGGRSVEQQDEGQPPRQRVDVVHAREAGLPEDGNGGIACIAHLDPDRRDAGRAQAGVEPEQEAARPVALRRRGAHDDDAVGGILVPARLFLDERGRVRERVPQRRLAAERQLLAERAPQRLEPTGPGKALAIGVRGERRVDLAHVDRNLDRTHAELPARGVGERPVDGRADRASARPDEDQGDALPTQAIPCERRVGQLDVLESRRLLAREAPLLLRRVVELPAQVRDLSLEQAVRRLVDVVGQADPDEDADDQREEDGRERGDVIAEVEHSELRRSLA